MAAPNTAGDVQDRQDGRETTTALIVPPASIEPRSEPADRAPQTAEDAVTIVLMGDTGMNGSDMPVRADGAYRHGRRLDVDRMLANVRSLIDGDVNIANLETVVTDRNDITSLAKQFNFRSHPETVRRLAGAGINVMTTANNHAIDYGPRGMLETLTHLDRLRADGRISAHAGVGVGRAGALVPGIAEVSGRRIAIGAIGIGGVRPSAQGPGQLSWHVAEDRAGVVAALADAGADYRVMALHYNAEMAVRPGADDMRRLRDEIVRAGGVDLVVGHHAHVPAGVQQVDGKLIFYGLGNFLHPGMRDMAGLGPCRDYGLMARVHLRPGPDGRLVARAVEAIALEGMHEEPRPMPPEDGALRIAALNHLAEDLDAPAAGASGVRFIVRADGTGLYCAPGADSDPGRIGALCRGSTGPSPASAAVARRVASACGTRGAVVAAARVRPGTPARGAPAQRTSSRTLADVMFGF
ncbi:MAG: CapA family protein [Hyphomicrobiaceae bacterium]|nr:CapA family protein [Hyphomicrobiaceae bacterium]